MRALLGIGRSTVRRALVGAVVVVTTLTFGADRVTASASGPALGNCGPNFGMQCAGEVAGVITGAFSEEVTGACEATALTEVAATGVSCYLLGVNNGTQYQVSPSELWTPGNASAIQVAMSVPIQPYEVCVSGGEVGIFGPPQAITNPICSFIVAS